MTDTVPQELLNCPFCGGAARYQRNPYHEVCCDACDFVGPARGTRADAIAAWNRRTDTAALRAQVVEEWPGDNYEQYETAHNAAIAAYEATSPTDYRYSASALRHAVDAAIRSLNGEQG